jgi:hypothetical protein
VLACSHNNPAGTDGKAVVYNVEATTLNWLQRTNVSLELFDTGGRVKFAGWPSKRSDDRTYALNILAANGQEIVLLRNVKPRWGTTSPCLGYRPRRLRVQNHTKPAAAHGRSEANRCGIRSHSRINSRRLHAEGHPAVMIQPPPIEIIDRGDTVLIRTEE